LSFLLEELPWPDARYKLMQAKAAIVPVGGIIQHGPHLPLEIDTITAEYYSRQVATRLYPYVVVTPTLSIGVAGDIHMTTVGTLTLSPETLSNVAYELAASLSKHGLKKVIFYNGHQENKQALEMASERLRKELALNTMVLNIRELYPEKGEEFLGTKDWSHASELETSEALYIFPDKVKKDRASTADDMLGVKGKASSATAEKGQRLVTSLVEIMVRLTEDFMLN